MKSAYLIAMISCFTMTWLYEEKKKRGIRVNAAPETALGYFVTRILLLVISEQSLRGSLTVLAMDLVTGGLWFLMTEKESGQRRTMEYLFFYIWNPVPVMAVIAQNKDCMVGIWLAVMGLSLLMRKLRRMEQEKKADRESLYRKNLLAKSGAERFREYRWQKRGNQWETQEE